MALSSRGALGALVLSLPLLLSACASTQDREVKKLQARSTYEQGMRSLGEKRVSLGMAALKEAIELDPENATYRNTLGVVLLDLKRPAEAQAEFQAALEIDKNNPEVHHNLGLSYAEQNRFDEAIVAYKKALAFPTYATPEVAYYNLGNAYIRLGKAPEAEESYRAAVQLEPTLISAHYGLGVALWREGKRDQAKESFRTARDLDPASPFAEAARVALKQLEDGR
jgi:Tfp pilus assembly protein PilF